MASVHHEAAKAFLLEAKKAGKDGEALRARIDSTFQGWGNNADKLTGYNTQHHHVALIVSRSLHDTLPEGRSEYACHYQHGFSDIMKHFDRVQPDAKKTAAWLDSAIKELDRVMAG